MNTDWTAQRQGLIFILVVALIYIISARPVESVTDFIVADEQVFLSGGPIGIRALDLSKTGELKMIASADVSGSARALALINKRLYVASGLMNINVYDITDSGSFKPREAIKTETYPQDLAAYRNILYTANGTNGLRIYKISKDGQADEVKEARVDEKITRVFVSEDRLFTTGNKNILKIYDIKQDPSKPALLGSYDVGDTIWDVQVIEQDAYIAANKLGFIGIDISQPMTITEKVRFDTPGRAMGMVIQTHYAIIADGKKGLRVIDILDPKQPRQVGEFDTWGVATQVALKGGDILLADGVCGLRRIQLSVVFKQEKENENQVFSAQNIQHSGSYYYMASGGNGLRVFSGAVNNLNLIGQYDSPGFAENVAVDPIRKLAYLADSRELSILDVSQSENQITLLKKYNPEQDDAISDVLLKDSYAYLALGQHGISALDVTDPKNPQKLKDEAINGQALSLKTSGDYLYVASGIGGLTVVNITDRNIPTVVSQLPLTGDVKSLALVSTRTNPVRSFAYVAASQVGMCIIETTQIDRLSLLGCRSASGAVEDVWVDEILGRAYVADEGGKLTVYSIAVPERPAKIGVIDIGVPLHRVTQIEGKLFLSTLAHGLRVIDVDDPVQPKELFRFDYPSLVESFAVMSDYAYYVDGSYGLHILDVERPGDFREIGLQRTPGQPKAVAVTEKLALVADGNQGLQIINITDPARPWIVRTVKLSGTVTSVAARGNFAYAATSEGNLAIVDIAIPEQAWVIGSLTGIPIPLLGVALYNSDYLLAACKDSGLASIYVEDPANPRILGVNQELRDVRSVTVQGDYALVAGGTDGFAVFDISHPLKLELVNRIPQEEPVEQVSVTDGVAFLAMGKGGVSIFNVIDPRQPVEVDMRTVEVNAWRTQAIWLPPAADSKAPGRYRIFLVSKPAGSGSDHPRGGSLQTITVKQEATFNQRSVYETPGTASFYEVFNYIFLWVDGRIKWFATPMLDYPLLNLLGKSILVIWNEIGEGVKAISNLLGTPWPQTGMSPKAGWTICRVLFFELGLLSIIGFLFWIGFFAQFVLPVRGVRQRWEAFIRLASYALGGHGVLAYIRNGEAPPSIETQSWQGPGVVLTDLASGVVVERRILPLPGVISFFRYILGRPEAPAAAPFGRDWDRRPTQPYRVFGPGLHFTTTHGWYRMLSHAFDEIIAGAVDLRTQIRTSDEFRTVTRDGIEVNTRVYCIFTIGAPVEVLTVAYEGDESQAHHLRVVNFKEKSIKAAGQRTARRVNKVAVFKDELDSDDQQDIHEVIPELRSRKKLKDEPRFREATSSIPYLYEPQRALRAVLARARQGETVQSVDWTQLPTLTGIEILHNLLARVFYDKLYLPLHPTENHYFGLRENFNRRVRNQGILAYQFVERRDHQPIQVDDAESELVFYPVRRCRQPRLLRLHGISVIRAGFTELRPVDLEVRRRLFDHWEARWKATEEMWLSGLEGHADELRAEIRAKGQMDMVDQLYSILNTNIPDEALAIRIFQALESVASDPLTRQFIPQEVVEMLRSMRGMLLQ